jgi:hypothetical protein
MACSSSPRKLRSSVAGLSETGRVSLAENYVTANAGSYPLLEADRLTVSAATSGSDVYAVTVNYDVSGSFIYALPFVPAPSATIVRLAVIPFDGRRAGRKRPHRADARAVSGQAARQRWRCRGQPAGLCGSGLRHRDARCRELQPSRRCNSSVMGVVDAWIGNVTAADMTNFTSKPNPGAATLVNLSAVTVTGRAHAGMGNTTPTSVSFGYSDITAQTKKP